MGLFLLQSAICQTVPTQFEQLSQKEEPIGTLEEELKKEKLDGKNAEQALWESVWENKPLLLQAVLKEHSEYVDKHGSRALHSAANDGYLEIIQLLIDNGADVNKPAGNGAVALHAAVSSGHVEIVKFLIAHGADVNKADNYRYTPIHTAIIQNKIEVMKLLLAHPKIDVNHSDERGNNTPLMQAARDCNVQAVELLLAHPNIDVNKTDEIGQTVLYQMVDEMNHSIHLMMASYGITRENQIKILKLLLAHPDIDVNKADTNNGFTPLYIAFNNKEIVELLLAHPKIIVDIPSKYEHTPFDKAGPETKKLLQEAMEKQKSRAKGL